MEMNPFTLVNGEPYPLDMRGELDDTAAFKNFKKYGSGFKSSLVTPSTHFISVLIILTIFFPIYRWGNIEFPLPFGRVLSPSESYIHELDEKVS